MDRRTALATATMAALSVVGLSAAVQSVVLSDRASHVDQVVVPSGADLTTTSVPTSAPVPTTAPDPTTTAAGVAPASTGATAAAGDDDHDDDDRTASPTTRNDDSHHGSEIEAEDDHGEEHEVEVEHEDDHQDDHDDGSIAEHEDD